jgi:hypothetical protein
MNHLVLFYFFLLQHLKYSGSQKNWKLKSRLLASESSLLQSSLKHLQFIYLEFKQTSKLQSVPWRLIHM